MGTTVRERVPQKGVDRSKRKERACEAGAKDSTTHGITHNFTIAYNQTKTASWRHTLTHH